MAKLKREHIIFAASWDGETWEALGKDNDDLSMELNPDTESSKNVLGESTFTHSGYEPEVGVDPYYADPDRTLYEKMLKNAIERKYGDEDIKGQFAICYFDEANKDLESMTGDAYVQPAYLVPESIGGDTAGAAIPFTVHPVGAPSKKKATYVRTGNMLTIAELGG